MRRFIHFYQPIKITSSVDDYNTTEKQMETKDVKTNTCSNSKNTNTKKKIIINKKLKPGKSIGATAQGCHKNVTMKFPDFSLTISEIKGFFPHYNKRLKL